MAGNGVIGRLRCVVEGCEGMRKGDVSEVYNGESGHARIAYIVVKVRRILRRYVKSERSFFFFFFPLCAGDFAFLACFCTRPLRQHALFTQRATHLRTVSVLRCTRIGKDRLRSLRFRGLGDSLCRTGP